MSSHLWVVRIDARSDDTHPEFIGPLTEDQARELGERLWRQMRRGYEIGPLVTEDELPGLWLEREA